MGYAVAFFFLSACICQAEEACPWINAATAAGVLDGEVTLQRTENTCVFTHNFSKLGIDVHTVSLPYKLVCGPSAMPLKAIGNEALACSPEEKNGKISEQVAGRVRDQAFTIRITTTDRSISRSSLREKAKLVAEQVAGNLF
jgi:hypothetical protein